VFKNKKNKMEDFGMIKILQIENFNDYLGTNINKRSEDVVFEKMDYVKTIVQDVKLNGDSALIKYTREFDGVELEAREIKVSDDEIERAFSKVELEFVNAVRVAISNLSKYHINQYPKDFSIEIDEGVELGKKWRAIDTVGLYVPGGRAPYVTACYMLGVPAKIAGCNKRIVCVPPDKKTGQVNPYVLVSAKLSGITDIYKVGGAQAIAAMAYGTSTIPKVGKIFGPGNVFVTAAKLMVYGTVDIDAPAGPSEAMIIADDTANYKYVAADILSQAEHDVNSAAIMLTTSFEYALKVKNELLSQVEALPKKEIVKEALLKYGAILVCPNIDLCLEIANDYAPEHIQVITKNSYKDADKVIHAGSVCIGEYTPIAVGDYYSGVNNVIPTGGASKMFSPVHVEAFMKNYQTQYLSKKGLEKMRNDIEIISKVEGFEAHFRSVDIRFSQLRLKEE
jgi:histidinol dehydrogenase